MMTQLTNQCKNKNKNVNFIKPEPIIAQLVFQFDQSSCLTANEEAGLGVLFFFADETFAAAAVVGAVGVCATGVLFRLNLGVAVATLGELTSLGVLASRGDVAIGIDAVGLSTLAGELAPF